MIKSEYTRAYSELSCWYFSWKQTFWWEETKLALWIGCSAGTWGFVQPFSRHLALHQTTLNLSYHLGFSEAASSLLPTHVVVTSPLPRGRCSTAGGEGQVRAENTSTKPVVWQSQKFNSNFLRQVQIHSGYTLNTSCFVQFGHKLRALGGKAGMQRPIAQRDTSTAAVVRVLQPGVCTGLNRSASRTACGAGRAGKNTTSSCHQWTPIPLWSQGQQDVQCGGQWMAKHYTSNLVITFAWKQLVYRWIFSIHRILRLNFH